MPLPVVRPSQVASTASKRYVSKRKKFAKKPFDFNSTTASRTSHHKSSGLEKKLYFQCNDFIAVRSENDGFYLAVTQGSVTSASTRVYIRWLESDANDSTRYVLSYGDVIDPNSIIAEVTLKRLQKNTYSLPEKQRLLVEKQLRKSVAGLAPSSDDDDDDDDGDDDGDDDDDEDVDDDEADDSVDDSDTSEPVQKKRKRMVKSRKITTKRVTPKRKKTDASDMKTDTKKNKKYKKGDKVETKPEKRKKKIDTLVPRPHVKVLEKDPLLETREKLPFVSTFTHSKLLLRAANLDDVKLLKQCIDDRTNIAKVDVVHSVGYFRDALDIALLHENVSAMKALCLELFNNKTAKRAAMTSSMLTQQNTGTYNKLSLGGIPVIRKLSLSRGSREGNNAFTKDERHVTYFRGTRQYLEFAVRNGVSKNVIDNFIAAVKDNHLKNFVYDRIYEAVRNGRRKLAGELMDEKAKTGQTTFNFLHRDVLMFDNEDLRQGILVASVKKRPWDNYKITPLHCAAINPNPKYLMKLLSILPEYSITDASSHRPIHYAAACEGTGPLEYLLNRGQDPNDADSTGHTVLHIACETGRAHNVELLLSRAASASSQKSAAAAGGKRSVGMATDAGEDDEDVEDQITEKYGIGGINQPIGKQNRHYTYCPLHIAAEKCDIEVAKVLLKHGAIVDIELGARKNKLTPLLIASSVGGLQFVRLLVSHGANPLHKDKLHRTSLMHAAMNGHAHVVSYFLNLGVGMDQADTSGNTALHYAVGYGWYYCTKILLDAGADPAVVNDWKTTPLAVAFLKGHVGLADLLLAQPTVDINLRLDSGMTLVSLACSSPLIDGIVDQITYLVITKNADCTIADASNMNALHHLARNDVCTSHSYSARNVPSTDAMKYSVEVAQLLVKQGCSPSTRDSDGLTPVMYALQQGNSLLVEFLVNVGSGISSDADKTNCNILHFLAKQCMQQQLSDVLLTIYKRTSDKNLLRDMAKQIDHDGFTPLIQACYQYKSWKGEVRDVKVSDSDSDDGSSDDDDVDSADGAAHKPKADKKLEKQIQEQAEDGRKFIEVMIQYYSSTAEKLAMKHFPKTKKRPKKKMKQYISPEVAGYSVVHFLVNVPHEARTTVPQLAVVSQQDDNSPCAVGLKSLLSHLNVVTDANLFDCHGRTPLMCAIIDGCKAAACQLIEFGVDVNVKSCNTKEDGNSTALLFAARYKQHSVIPLLLSHGANISDVDTRSGCSALHYVLQYPVLDCFKATVDALVKNKASLSAVDKTKKTPLHYLVLHSRLGDSSEALAVAGILLSGGANVNACDDHQRTPLHWAVSVNTGGANSSTAMEQLLLDRSTNPVAADCRQRLPIHYVFVKIGRHKDISSVDPVELCSTLTSATDKRRSVVNHADQFGHTPLHLAARRGAGVCAIHLIQKGANVNARDINGNTPLSLAVINGHESCTMLLLQQKADISVNIYIVPDPPEQDDEDKDEAAATAPAATNKSSCSSESFDMENDDRDDDASEHSSSSSEGSDGEEAETKKKKKKKKKKPAWIWQPMKAKEKSKQIVSYSVFQGVILKDWQGITFMMLDVLDMFAISLSTVIEAAIVTNKYHLAKSLIRRVKNKSELMTLHINGQNLVHILARTSKLTADHELLVQVAEMLHYRGVSFTLQDNFGCTPLHYACLQCSLPLIEFILDKVGAKSCMQKKSKAGSVPLALVFWKSHAMSCVIDVVKKLLSCRATLDVLCAYPSPPTYLFGYKPQLDTDDSEDYTRVGSVQVSPVIQAVLLGNFEMTQELIRRGASVNFADTNGRTPLMAAISVNNVHIVRALLDAGYEQPKDDIDDVDEMAVKPYVDEASDDDDTSVVGSSFQPRQVFALGRKHAGLKSTAKLPAAKAKQPTKIHGINVDCKIYPKTSNVDVTAVDHRGHTALHYLVNSAGSFDNYRLLVQLVSAGVPLMNLELALECGLSRIATALQLLKDRNCAHVKLPCITISAVDDNVTFTTPRPDFSANAEAVLKKFEAGCHEDADSKQLELQPDDALDIAGTGQVMTDPDLNTYCDVLLFKIDVRAGFWGMYNFYKMQIVHQKGKDLYILFTRWGRIGDQGQHQQTPFQTFAEAQKEFRKIFRAKSGNDWLQLPQKPFEHKPRKYHLIPMEDRYFGKELPDMKLDLPSSNLPSKLHPYVQDVIKELTDVTAMTKAMKTTGVSRQLFPLGRMNKQKLLDARQLLAQLQVLVKNVEKMQEAMPMTDMDKYANELEKIAQLSNEFYHLMPRSGFEFERIPILDTSDEVQKEWKNVETLLELEIASKIMAGALYRIKEINPLDYVYRCLNCKIELMDEMSSEAQHLLRYISATHSGKIEAIFRLCREGESDRLLSCGVDLNHRLLFHGSSSSNLISILSRGLLIAPPEAPASGYLFGKGIYTSDQFSKSCRYCYNYSRDSTIKFMLVCQVALGKFKDVYERQDVEGVPAGYDSVRAVAASYPDPQYDLTLPSGVVLPLGSTVSRKEKDANKAQRHDWMPHHEYVVYREEQVALRYLIQFTS